MIRAALLLALTLPQWGWCSSGEESEESMEFQSHLPDKDIVYPDFQDKYLRRKMTDLNCVLEKQIELYRNKSASFLFDFNCNLQLYALDQMERSLEYLILKAKLFKGTQEDFRVAKKKWKKRWKERDD
jgi:hypothetical protein